MSDPVNVQRDKDRIAATAKTVANVPASAYGLSKSPENEPATPTAMAHAFGLTRSSKPPPKKPMGSASFRFALLGGPARTMVTASQSK